MGFRRTCCPRGLSVSESEGLVERHYHKELPPRVEYTLTEKGWAVRPILISLMDWSGDYLEGIAPQDVGEAVTTDFAARVLPAFWFEAEKAEGISGSLRVEIEGCTDCSGWTYTVADGRLLPRREGPHDVDATLRTTSEGCSSSFAAKLPCGLRHARRRRWLRSPPAGMFPLRLVPSWSLLHSSPGPGRCSRVSDRPAACLASPESWFRARARMMHPR